MAIAQGSLSVFPPSTYVNVFEKRVYNYDNCIFMQLKLHWNFLDDIVR